MQTVPIGSWKGQRSQKRLHHFDELMPWPSIQQSGLDVEQKEIWFEEGMFDVLHSDLRQERAMVESDCFLPQVSS